MNRVLKIAIDEVIVNPAEAGKMVDDACRHKISMRVVGMCEACAYLLVTLEPVAENAPLEYVFAPFDSTNDDEILSEINTRYINGFTALGSFQAGSEIWGFFAYDRNLFRVKQEGGS